MIPRSESSKAAAAAIARRMKQMNYTVLVVELVFFQSGEKYLYPTFYRKADLETVTLPRRGIYSFVNEDTELSHYLHTSASEWAEEVQKAFECPDYWSVLFDEC